MTGLTYLASPYSHAEHSVRLRRFIAACEAAAELMRQGKVVFSPIAHSHPVATHGGLDALDAELWRTQDRVLLDQASEVVVLMLPGWEQSAGVLGEVMHAGALGIPVTYMEALD